MEGAGEAGQVTYQGFRTMSLSLLQVLARLEDASALLSRLACAAWAFAMSCWNWASASAVGSGAGAAMAAPIKRADERMGRRMFNVMRSPL